MVCPECVIDKGANIKIPEYLNQIQSKTWLIGHIRKRQIRDRH
jgi:hypothetical protein